jgi:hypothetical protein
VITIQVAAFWVVTLYSDLLLENSGSTFEYSEKDMLNISNALSLPKYLHEIMKDGIQEQGLYLPLE